MARNVHTFGASRLALLAAVCGLTGCAVSPVEFSTTRLAEIADDKLARVTGDQEPIGRTVDLFEAMARAVKYNLDHQVELAEQALRERELELAHYSLLPGIVAGSGYTARDKVNASSSRNALTGLESLAVSTSQDLRLRAADIAFSWNILDFGLSYVRARQSADKVLVQAELRRKVVLRILEEVRTAYWRAASAQRLQSRLDTVAMLAREAESEARRVFGERETSAITALTMERELVEVQRTLGEVRRELDTAKEQLAALINVKPGTPYKVAAHRLGTPRLQAGNMQGLIKTALMNRPELREVEYRKRINEQEAHAALLEMLPGAQLLAGANFDSNSFLLHNNWVNWGAKASWNLMRVFSIRARKDVIEQQDDMLDKRSLAVTMAIMTQVYVSRARYASATRDYRTAERYRNVQQKLLDQIRIEAGAGRIARQTLVREELNAVVAEAKLDIAYAITQAALANVQSSLGVDPPGVDAADGSSVAALAKALRGGPATAASGEFKTSWHAADAKR